MKKLARIFWSLTALLLIVEVIIVSNKEMLEHLIRSVFGPDPQTVLVMACAVLPALILLAGAVYYSTRRPPKIGGGDFPTIIIALCLTGCLAWPSKATAKDTPLPVAQESGAPIGSFTFATPHDVYGYDPIMSPYFKTNVFELNTNGVSPPKDNILLCAAVGAAIVGTIYVGYRIYKACQRIKEQNDKKMKDADPDGTNSLAASFVLSIMPPDQSDTNDCGCLQTFAFAFVNTSTGTTPVLVPQETEVATSEEDFRIRHGLSTNEFVNSFGAGGSPTNTLPGVSMNGDVLTVTFEEKVNVESVVEFSADLKNWQRIAAISAPEGMEVHFQDATHPSANVAFYRIVRQE